MINTRHADTASRAVSDPGASVADMSTHVCVWFEDSWPEHLCVCGARAVMLVDEDGEGTLVVLDEPAGSEVPTQRMPLSA